MKATLAGGSCAWCMDLVVEIANPHLPCNFLFHHNFAQPCEVHGEHFGTAILLQRYKRKIKQIHATLLKHSINSCTRKC